jgi:uncharacterized protein YgbK (DUF1537 family)
MIAVIADDFTGAAEIGGVGLRYGLKVLIETVVNDVSDVDLLVIATDTRSLGAEDASQEMATITSQLMKLQPDMIFKKIDSVLRGHVARELEAQMHITGKSKAVIVAPNPSVGRTIVDGWYFVDSLPLNETFFAEDPDFLVRSALVTDIVQSSEFPVCSLRLDEKMPDAGLFIADVSSSEELNAWAARINREIEVAGGSGFFGALLENIYHKKASTASSKLSFRGSSLFVFGSMYPKQAGMLEKFYSNQVVKMNMPDSVYYNSESCSNMLDNWALQVAGKLKNGLNVMVTIDHQPVNESGLALWLRESIGKLVVKVQDHFNLNDLFIEGGATTSVVLKYLNVTKLYPFNEADFGIIQMKAEGYPDLCITTKPGSYMWPEHLVFENADPTFKKR